MSIFSPAGFPVSHSQSLDGKKAKTITGISGQKCYELYQRYAQIGSLVKMCLASSAWHSTIVSLTWKVKVTKQKRLLYQLVPSTHRTDEIESGLLHTPTAKANQLAPSMNSGWGATPNTVKMWRTPDANCGRGPSSAERMDWKILWPTPAASEGRLGYQYRGNGKKGSQKSLSTIVIDNEGGRDQTTGQLNPTWVEWLMGYPQGWTDLKDLETQ